MLLEGPSYSEALLDAGSTEAVAIVIAGVALPVQVPRSEVKLPVVPGPVSAPR